MKHDKVNRKSYDEIDGMLDAALAKYVAEPRAQLEERILANLRTADARVTPRAGWTWSFIGAVAAVILVAATVAWRLTRPTPPRIVNHPSGMQQTPVPDRAAVQQRPTTRQQKHPHKLVQHRRQNVAVATNPKLEVFPSPLPLSEQEKLLAIYVSEYPEHAALVAEARMDAIRQQDEERRRIIAVEDSKR
jgi:hypothetical protein